MKGESDGVKNEKDVVEPYLDAWEHHDMSPSTIFGNWAAEFRIKLVVLPGLLGLLRLWHPNVPKDAWTLLKTRQITRSHKL